MYTLDIEFQNIILNILNKKCTQKRKPKYSNEYYLRNILLVLTDLQKWESLKLTQEYKDKKEFHYKTIQDIHLKWSKLNIYQEAYNILLTKYTLAGLKKSKNLDLFIDTSLIYNKTGCEDVSYGQNPKKKESKISAICDINKTLLSVSVVKTSLNDAKTVNSSLEDLFKNDIKFNTINLIGDKGYATKVEDKKELFIKYRVNLV